MNVTPSSNNISAILFVRFTCKAVVVRHRSTLFYDSKGPILVLEMENQNGRVSYSHIVQFSKNFSCCSSIKPSYYVDVHLSTAWGMDCALGVRSDLLVSPFTTVNGTQFYCPKFSSISGLLFLFTQLIRHKSLGTQ